MNILVLGILIFSYSSSGLFAIILSLPFLIYYLYDFFTIPNVKLVIKKITFISIPAIMFMMYFSKRNLRIQNEMEFTGTHKLRKVNLRKQGYDIHKILDPIYLWNPSKHSYNSLNKEDYTEILNGKLRI